MKAILALILVLIPAILDAACVLPGTWLVRLLSLGRRRGEAQNGNEARIHAAARSTNFRLGRNACCHDRRAHPGRRDLLRTAPGGGPLASDKLVSHHSVIHSHSMWMLESSRSKAAVLDLLQKTHVPECQLAILKTPA